GIGQVTCVSQARHGVFDWYKRLGFAFWPFKEISVYDDFDGAAPSTPVLDRVYIYFRSGSSLEVVNREGETPYFEPFDGFLDRFKEPGYVKIGLEVRNLGIETLRHLAAGRRPETTYYFEVCGDDPKGGEFVRYVGHQIYGVLDDHIMISGQERHDMAHVLPKLTTEHPNGATDISGVLIAARDPADMASDIGPLGGLDFEGSDPRVATLKNGSRLIIASPDALTRLYPPFAHNRARSVVAPIFTVADLAETEAYLAGQALKVAEFDGRVVAVDDYHPGMPVIFEGRRR
ncbi:MAG: hypothetical protein MI755_18925, partial [Sphingomonadales bacterium]|nr:hypothetical protein [Sphingomonadales bacterium]